VHAQGGGIGTKDYTRRVDEDDSVEQLLRKLLEMRER
jgi:hypothetical protein